MSDEEYEKEKESHAPFCDKNHEGSSGAMEAAAAIAVWDRSQNHKFRYVTFVSEEFLQRCEKKLKIPYKKKMRNRRLERDLSYGPGRF